MKIYARLRGFQVRRSETLLEVELESFHFSDRCDSLSNQPVEVVRIKFFNIFFLRLFAFRLLCEWTIRVERKFNLFYLERHSNQYKFKKDFRRVIKVKFLCSARSSTA